MSALEGSAFAPAKVNLFLHVGAPDAEGFHPLCSLMAFADVGDRLSVEPGDALGLGILGPFAGGLGELSDNLVIRAAKALIAEARRPVPPVFLRLEKLLPVASGLGGGSSDAGAALRLLRDTLGLDVDDVRLEAIAATLGSDGAACLWGRPVVAEGRGERLSPAPGLPQTPAVLVNPSRHVPTPAVYRALDSRGRFGDVTPPPMPDAFESVQELAAWLSLLENDLEAPAIDVEPAIAEVLDVLRSDDDVLLARVSGSGATCFALCADDLAAKGVAERIEAMQPFWWVKACRLGGPWDPA